MQKLPIVFLVIGVVVSVLALLFGFQLFPSIFKKKISEQSRLINGTDKWESWRVVPIPVFQKIYIFNVTNPDEVLKGGKPILDELGPYVYQHKRTKVDISVNELDDTVSYKHHDEYFFLEDLSNGKLTDKITVLNIPYLGAVYKSMLAGAPARYLVSEILVDFPGEDLYVHCTVDEFLFGGYFVPFMVELSALKGETLLPNNTFGLYYGKNGSESGTYEVVAGVKDPDNFGRVVSFNGETTLGVFNDEKCDKVRGYDGSMMAPFLTKEKEFYLFVPSLCRSMKFVYDSDTDVMGIPAFKFTVPGYYLADVKTNPENLCYCSNPGEDGESCLKSGAWELAPCRQGTPMVMSFPHFYSGDEEYLSQSVGLNPIQEEHEMVVVLEPTAAISLKVAIRVQMNFAIKPTKYFKKLKNIPEMVHPIFWMDQGVTLPPPVLQMVKDKLIKTQDFVRTGTYAFAAVGCIFIIIAALICFCRSRKAKSTEYNVGHQASLNKTGTSGTQNVYEYIETPTKPDWMQLTPNDKYSHVASPPNPRAPVVPEEQPFLPQQNGHILSRPLPVPVPAPVVTYRSHSPAVRMDSSPVIVGLHPKVDEGRSRDEVDVTKSAFPPAPATSRSMNALGVPFPNQNQFSSSNSVNNDLNDINNTFKDINDALSSYENLK